MTATRWLASAARLGNVSAQVAYATRLLDGRGIAKDERQAARWFELAANAGDPVAQNRLARILASDTGISADAVAAAKWHYLASKMGETDEWLDAFVEGLTADQRQRALDAAQHFPGDGRPSLLVSNPSLPSAAALPGNR